MRYDGDRSSVELTHGLRKRLKNAKKQFKCASYEELIEQMLGLAFAVEKISRSSEAPPLASARTEIARIFDYLENNIDAISDPGVLEALIRLKCRSNGATKNGEALW